MFNFKRLICSEPALPYNGINQINDNFKQKILRCPYEKHLYALPLVKWYKVMDDGSKNHIYTYDGRRNGGVEVIIVFFYKTTKINSNCIINLGSRRW